MSIKRAIDPVAILDWILRVWGLLGMVYWMRTRLQKVAVSRKLLLPTMKAVRWLAIIRYSLPRESYLSQGSL